VNFAFSKDEDVLRRDVQDFIRSHLTAEVLAEIKIERNTGRRGDALAAFYGAVFEKGYLGTMWPKEYGGQGGGPMAQFIVEEEFYRATDVRISEGGSGIGAILACGSEEQRRSFIPGLIRRDIVLCQGYTEPDCGTDLAGIRCSAIRRGDHYVINGHKTYNSDAHYATHIYLMARTDPASHRHAGLSILLVPMDLPGITVRPLWTIQNDPPAPLGTTYGIGRVNDVFFQDVEVRASCLLGGEGEGWSVAMRGLNLDRVGAFRYLISVMHDEDFVNWLNHDPQAGPLRDDPVVQDKLAEMWIEAQVCRLMTMRSMSIIARGEDFTYEGAAEKVWAPEHGVRASEAYCQMLGPYGQLLSSSPDAIEHGRFSHNVLGAFQSTVNHGSVNVMRDQIARKGLGMPRPPMAR
jgi:3-oxocholest-4-en-26-oyl-CoA dehydrogenase alpha subunit